MLSAKRMPEILRSNKLSTAGAIEMVLYLAVPWAFDIPWSILYHLVLFETAVLMHHDGLFAGTGWLFGVEIAFWYLLGFWPALVTAYFAKRRDPAHSWRAAFLLGHCFVLTNYLSYACAWRALWRILRGQTGWAKTARIAEADPQPQTPPPTRSPDAVT
jgi:1,2-diacylglycerol 3-beta-glucosyltransferase